MVNDEMPLSIGKGILFFIQFQLRTYPEDRQRPPMRTWLFSDGLFQDLSNNYMKCENLPFRDLYVQR